MDDHYNRGSINAEYIQLINEINRIGSVTTYNNSTLLSGYGNIADKDEAVSTALASATTGGVALQISGAAAGTYTFDFTNVGSMQHDLRIEGGGLDDGTAVIGPGETDSVTVTLEPGTYTIYCSVGNHRAQGMEVEITVS